MTADFQTDAQPKPRNLLSRDAILGADDLIVEEVYIEEWGGTVRIKALTGGERDAYEQSLIQGKGKNQQLNLRNARSRLVAMAAVDDQGKPMFKLEDVAALSRKSAAPLDKCFTVARRLSGLSEADVEELTGNSEAALSDGSGSN